MHSLYIQYFFAAENLHQWWALMGVVGQERGWCCSKAPGACKGCLGICGSMSQDLQGEEEKRWKVSITPLLNPWEWHRLTGRGPWHGGAGTMPAALLTQLAAMWLSAWHQPNRCYCYNLRVGHRIILCHANHEKGVPPLHVHASGKGMRAAKENNWL